MNMAKYGKKSGVSLFYSPLIWGALLQLVQSIVSAIYECSHIRFRCIGVPLVNRYGRVCFSHLLSRYIRLLSLTSPTDSSTFNNYRDSPYTADILLGDLHICLGCVDITARCLCSLGGYVYLRYVHISLRLHPDGSHFCGTCHAYVGTKIQEVCGTR